MITNEEKIKACKEYFAEEKMKLNQRNLYSEMARMHRSSEAYRIFGRILIWKELYGCNPKEIYEKINYSKAQYYRELNKAYVTFYEIYLS